MFEAPAHSSPIGNKDLYSSNIGLNRKKSCPSYLVWPIPVGHILIVIYFSFRAIKISNRKKKKVFNNNVLKSKKSRSRLHQRIKITWKQKLNKVNTKQKILTYESSRFILFIENFSWYNEVTEVVVKLTKFQNGMILVMKCRWIEM